MVGDRVNWSFMDSRPQSQVSIWPLVLRHEAAWWYESNNSSNNSDKENNIS